VPEKSKQEKRQALRQTLAYNVFRFRKAREWKQEDLAEISNLSRQMINGIENASRNVSLDNLDQLAEALGTETYVLLLPTLRPDYMRRSNDSIKVAE